jgi:tRNA(Ile)-lysidine synthase
MKQERSLEAAARSSIERHSMLSGGERVVVAVSGGPDSVALLYFLHGLADEMDLDLHLFHLDHILRGDESRADAAFVESLAGEFSLPVRSIAVDVRAHEGSDGLSPEEAAREVRMTRLRDFAGEIGAERIALGHTADDQVETFLMRIVQGAGLTGLSGIPYVSGPLIRPLLDVWRVEVEEYCGRMGVRPRTDSSNLDRAFLRNRVRLGLVPFLESEFGPGVKEVVLREVESLSLDGEYLQGRISEAFSQVGRSTGEEIRLEIEGLLSLPPALQRGCLRAAWNNLVPRMQSLSWVHLRDIQEKVMGGNTGAGLDLPGGVVVEREYGELVFRVREAHLEVGELTLEVPGSVTVPVTGAVIEAKRVPREEIRFNDDTGLEFVKPDIAVPLKVRTPMPGDRFTPLGARGSRKLKDYFIDAKVPRASRKTCPIVLSGQDIVWVAGHRIDERFRLEGTEDEALMLIIRQAGAYDSR